MIPEYMTPEHTIARIEDAGYGEALHGIAKRLRISPKVIVGRRRFRTQVTARRTFCVLLRDTFGLSFPEIGWLLGRDHTSVMNLLRPHEAQMRAIAERYQDAAE